MRKRTIIMVCLGLCSCLCLFQAGAARAAEPDAMKRVLVVHSYHETQEGHVVEMTAGIEEALAESDVLIKYFHMDTKRKKDLEWKKKAGRMAARMMEEFKPVLVITMDDNAQQFFAKNYAGKKDAPIFVFGGVNADPAKYGFPAENVTGVLERPNVRESIELLQKIVPDVKKMVILSDKSPTTDSFCDYSKKLELPVEVLAYEQPRTFAEWKAAIGKYADRVDGFGIYVIRTIQRSREDKTHVHESELMAYLNENYKTPSVGFFDSAARAGVLCGISVSMKEQGYAAAKIAAAILKGARPADFTVAPTSKGRILLNLKTAEKLGVQVRYRIIRNAVEVIK
ncbi:MAG: hypothetical protein GY859_31920 [Desulfobacterales bacterium]|nr:hypothetical protein [Desulfobacterales bacterium]